MKKNLFLLSVFFIGISGYCLPQRVLFNFEENTGSWSVIEGSTTQCILEQSSQNATEGYGCLKCTISFPGEAGIKTLLNENWTGYQTLMFDMVVTETPLQQVKFFVYIKDREWLWYQTKSYPVKFGTTKISINISGSSLDLTPSGHKKPWNQYSLEQIRELGIKFISDAKFTQSFYIDNIRLLPVLFSSLKVNRTEVPLYEKFEISFKTPVYFPNPFDPDCIAIDGYFVSPSGREIVVPGFFYQDFYFAGPGTKGQDNLQPQGLPEWKIRFSPTEKGVYKYKITASINKGEEIFSTSTMTFRAIDSKNPGFVRTSKKDIRYFEFDNGSFFYPIGHNIRSLNDNRYSQLFHRPLAAQDGTINFETWLNDMEKNKENFFETWMAAWWLAIEWKKGYDFYEGLGRYDLRNAWKLDWILEIASKKGIYIQLLIVNHGSVSTYCDQEWQDSPYNIKNGGFLNSPEEFFTNPQAKDLFKKRLRYIIARWSYSPNIFSWELVNEMNLIGASNNFYKTDVLANWYAEIGDYLSQIDPNDHMITGHYTILYDSDVFKLPQVDYVLTNAYYDVRGGNIVDYLKVIANFNARFNKPHFVSEYGGNWNAGPEALIEADLHNGIWAGSHLPFAATALFWWHNFIEEKNLYFHYKALAEYMTGVDRLKEKLDPKQVKITGENENNIKSLCLAGQEKALIWVYGQDRLKKPPSDSDPPLTKNNQCLIEDLIPGDYVIEFWDTYTGKIVKTEIEKNQGSLSFMLPETNRDFAIKIYRKS
ncbi:MAG TPA: DUF5060 domain-containing protein [bacterium]|nr:DUF5060 domain-containing protein [bacterium]HOL35225.1 DUF5060 domain-containing protein [bacterium]HPP08214.1 DUF5060 domain-containing protein [bacterium]